MQTILLLVGIIGIFITLHLISEATKARKWPSVPGEIVVSEMRKKFSDGNFYYESEILYEYEVAGKTYSSEKIKFGWQANKRWDVEARLEKYPIGRRVVVYHDPEKPERSVLEPGGQPGLLVMLVLSVFMVIMGLFATPT